MPSAYAMHFALKSNTASDSDLKRRLNLGIKLAEPFAPDLSQYKSDCYFRRFHSRGNSKFIITGLRHDTYQKPGINQFVNGFVDKRNRQPVFHCNLMRCQGFLLTGKAVNSYSHYRQSQTPLIVIRYAGNLVGEAEFEYILG